MKNDIAGALRSLEEIQRPQYPFAQGAFKGDVWDHSNVPAILELLLDERSSYRGHKEIALKALTAWLINGTRPDRQKAVQAAVALAIVDEVALAERKVLDTGLAAIGPISDYAVRMAELGIYFLNEVYYPVGGILSLRRAPASGGYKKRLLRQSELCVAPTDMMMIYHFHYVSVRRQAGDQPVQIAVAELVAKVTEYVGKKEPPAARTVTSHWAYHKNHVALLYAATLVKDEGETIFQLMRTGRLTVRTFQRHVRLLVAYATWISQHLLAGYLGDVGLANLSLLPRVSAIEPELRISERQTRNLQAGLALS